MTRLLAVVPLLVAALGSPSAFAQSCTPTDPRTDPGTSFTPFAALERLEVRGGRPGTQDWEWGLGTNTQQAGSFVQAYLDWISGRVLTYTLAYDGAGAGTFSVYNGGTLLVSKTWNDPTRPLRAGNALKFYVKESADSGSATVVTTVTSINGKSVAGSIQTAGNGQFSEASMYWYYPPMAQGFSVTGTVQLNFSGTNPPQGSRLNFLVTAGNVTCTPPVTSALYFISTDHLNTPRLITDANQQVRWRWDQQEPFGVNAPDENPAALGAFEFPGRFPGQYADQETNGAYNMARDFFAQLGRYLESDPIGLRGGLNTYAYVGSSPISYSDPTGFETYQCMRPLEGQPGSKRNGPDIPGNPFYHQYSCTRDAKGNLVCNSQSNSGSWWNSPGKPSGPNDRFNPLSCTLTVGDNRCFEECLIEEWKKPRPRYGVPFGVDCQEYDDNVNAICRKKCGLK